VRDYESTIGRLLIALTYVATALLLVGVLLMLASGISPLSGGPRLDVASLPIDLATLTPSGFLWLGLLAVIAIPISRVVAAAIAFARAGERGMVGIALTILVVLAIAIGSAVVGR
jgi:uncharacterized membrane protein